MANKRMFTMKIVDSDAFLDMPLSTQCLYFHLIIKCEDSGYIHNLKTVLRSLGIEKDVVYDLEKHGYVKIEDESTLLIINFDEVRGIGEAQKARHSLEYKQWRNAVLKRDNHTCVKCGTTDNIQVHHIVRFRDCMHEDKMFDVDNGICLCKKCHFDEHGGNFVNG